jgi:HrpA-like RNA helicase
MIGVTEPRRIAAISMAKRVGHELNLSPSEVSFQVRALFLPFFLINFFLAVY